MSFIRRTLMVVAAVISIAAANGQQAMANNVCEGAACSSVSIKWNGSQQIVHNYSNRTVVVHVDGAWTGSQDLKVPPGGQVAMLFTAYRNPYRADFQ